METVQSIEAVWEWQPLMRIATINGRACAQTFSAEIHVKLMRGGVGYTAHAQGLCVSMTQANHLVTHVATVFRDTIAAKMKKSAQVHNYSVMLEKRPELVYQVQHEEEKIITCACVHKTGMDFLNPIPFRKVRT